MGKSYLGVCEDAKRNGLWVQTLSVPEGDYNTLSGSIWRGVKARIRKPKSSYEVYTIGFNSFQEFVEWHKSQPGYGEGWHLDKDLLSSELTYSPYTCCLLPADLNVLMQGIGSWKRGEMVGSSYFKRDGNWRAYGNDFYKQVHLGYHDTQEAAHKAWKLDKASRIEAYPKDGLSGKIQNALKNLVDRLRGSGAEYTHRHGKPNQENY